MVRGKMAEFAALAEASAASEHSFGDEAPSGIRGKFIEEPSPSAESPQPQTNPSSSWKDSQYVQLTNEGHAIGASQGVGSWLDARRAAELGHAVRSARGLAKIEITIDDTHVKLVRMVLPSGPHYLAVLTGGQSGKIRRSPAKLSPMQQRVARLAADGGTTHQLGTQLGISSNTVKFHLKRVYEALGVSNRVELADALIALESAK